MLVKWLSEIVGFPPGAVMIAKEVPFMQSTATGKPAGKIDLVVASDAEATKWYGLEIQAVYFSGGGMKDDFETLRTDTGESAPFPGKNRRPDYRSSSAKRLMPQLQVKGPILRQWQSKIAVAVDKPFYENIGGRSPKAKQDLNAGDVIWLVPELRDGKLEPWHWEVLPLEKSYEKLKAAEEGEFSEFKRTLCSQLRPI